jgi:hypothetical protein
MNKYEQSQYWDGLHLGPVHALQEYHHKKSIDPASEEELKADPAVKGYKTRFIESGKKNS